MKPSIDSRIVDAVSIASRYPVITRVGIFGSYARGEQTADSDIDILYDYAHDVKNTAYVLGILEFIEKTEIALKQRLGNNIESDYVSLRGIMESANTTVKDSILNDTVWVYSRE